MVDLKLSVLYGATFGVRFAVRVALVAVPLVLAGARPRARACHGPRRSASPPSSPWCSSPSRWPTPASGPSPPAQALHARGGSFRLARMFITCCVADSTALSAEVSPPATGPLYAKDTWLAVDGAVEGRGKDLRIRAARVTEMPKPGQPHASFDG